MTTATEAPAPTKSKAAWKKRAVHKDITLPSGAVIDITLPNLPKLIKGGQVPNPLVDAAVGTNAMSRKPTREDVENMWDFLVWLIPTMVVSPEITGEDVPDLPVEDIEKLLAFANRSDDIDAVGKHLGGLETHQSFRDLRGIFSSNPSLSDV